MMKTLIATFTLILFSHALISQEGQASYNQLWAKVHKLEKEVLTKSALEVVEVIWEKAKKEKNPDQVIKSLLFKSKYALILEEDAQLKVINGLKFEISKTEFPVKNVLESYLANLYWQYFQQNRYQFYNRTTTDVKVDSADFRTWDLTTLFKEITVHFEQSLQQPERLQKEKLKNFEEILYQQEGSETYRPTLFDVLAHTALQFFRTDETSITRPADKFQINDPELLCEAYSFTQLKISSSDSTSLEAKALQVYKELVALHFSNPQLDALVAVDIERLKYIYSKAVFSNKDQYFLEVLQQSAENLKHHETAALYQYEIAELLYSQGNSYTVNLENQWKLKEAIALCDAVYANFPDSRGAKKCAVLKSRILATNLQLTAEKNVPNNQPSHLLVNYKNHEVLEFRAYSISKKQLVKLQELYPVHKQLAYILDLDVKTSWTAKLKNEGDYQSHSIEVPMPALTNGQYVILATPTVLAKKDINDQSFAFSPIQVTGLALSETRTPAQHLFQVVDRNNGKSKKDAKITIYYKKNYRGPMLSKNFTTDANGWATMDLRSNSIQIQYTEVTYKEEKAFFDGTYINQKQKDTKKPQITYKTFLFKDRSIYRPGQPIYFKGILIEKDDMVSKVASEESLTVGLYDANGQKVSEIDVATNDFGSFTGEFLLPSNGLTGQYYIKVYGVSCLVEEYSYFSVEEYKRPKFETSFIPVEGTFRVNDSIIVKGAATAFAGSTISGAKVNYRIQRNVNYPQWYYWSRSYYGGASQEIAHGETSTDNEGNFEIKFKAIPDASADKKGLPVFNYTITADVTDINGETRSTATTVRVGYHAMEASILVGSTLDKSLKEQKIYINTQNLNGQKLPAKGVLKIHKLKAPDHVLRNRPWPAPDYRYWGKKDFKTLYPHDAYAKENDPNHWEKGKLVFETKFNTGKSEEIDLKNFKKWVSGQYIVALETTDAFGQKVEAKTRTSVFNEKEKTLPDNQLFQVKTNKTSYGVGDMAEVTFYSNAKDSYITVWVEKDKKIIRKEEIYLNEGCESISVPVTPLDRGGFTVHYNFTIYNSFQSGSVPISVPYPSSDLEIETLTFRDKLRPGTDETWSFKIKGPKGEKVVAELLANMYDASLNQFRGNYWSFNPIAKPYYYSNIYTNANQSFGNVAFTNHNQVNSLPNVPIQGFDRFEWFGLNINTHLRIRGYASGIMKRKEVSRAQAEVALTDDMDMEADVSSVLQGNVAGVAVNSAPLEEKSAERQQALNFHDVQIRKNLQETAFFFPQLTTDKEGNVSFSFSTPEALTRWNLQLLAYTKDLKSAIKTLSTVTQKELMVLPNPPRFLREGDAITISSKISNLSDKNLEGFGQLELTDALTGKRIDSLLGNVNRTQNFSVDTKGNTQLSWNISIPKGIQAVQYKIVAKAGDFSDGEQNMLPVLTNRMLVTETLPMWVRSNQTKAFTLDKLKDNTSTTLSNHKLTLEITSNPAWYAVQALPYLMEYPYECNEQTFSRYYANSLATHIANSNPRIQDVFKQWANTDALLSNLEKNQELKSLLIQETPWLRDAQSETEQKKRIALLFNLNKMKSEQEIALRKLQSNQLSSGAWPWFKGGRENRYITQHIITGLGHLKKLNVTPSGVEAQNNKIIKNAVQYLDNEFVKEYNRMKKYATDLSKDHLSNTQIHYLYMRSFFSDIKTSKKVDEITAYYQGQVQKYWTKRNLYAKGMLALIMHRAKDVKTANSIIRSLKENSIVSDEMGMYWKANTNSWYWYQAPIETQSLLIEAFSEIENDNTTIDNLKIWLLKNKQTNQWKTTKATTEAVYALLLQGSDWLSVTDAVDVLVGGEKIEPSKLEDVKVEAGTGYYKTAWNTTEIQPEMGTVSLSKKGNGIAWGALYWQYFEDLDKITSAETPLQLKKKLFLKKNTDVGEEISEVTQETDLKVGDLVRVRIELKSDRDMEFLHMKDMRAAGFEPVNVFSQYKWQDGLGYYESTKDASTNFFFDYLPKGVYVFEYDLRVNNAGEFSNGITTIQSMYAPEFTSHSEGVRVNVGDR